MDVYIAHLITFSKFQTKFCALIRRCSTILSSEGINRKPKISNTCLEKEALGGGGSMSIKNFLS